MSQKILITSALPYVNNIPHLGNIIGSVLSADVINRYYKNNGYNTLYICGGDEYGTATELKAEELNISCRELCDHYIKIHKEIYDWFQIEFDYFGRTSTNNPLTDEWIHTQISQDIFQKLYNNNYLIKKDTLQLYSPIKKRFMADRYVLGQCPKCAYDSARGDQCSKCGELFDSIELINPVCALDKSSLEIKNTSHLFLDISKFKDNLLNMYYTNKSKWSHSAQFITETFLNDEIKERCITRDIKWATPIPQSINIIGPNKNMYNWFDAPIGYISITQQYLTNKGFHCDEWKKWWQDKNTRLIQFMSKDNVPFHSIIFPATLFGTHEKYVIPEIASSEYLLYEGKKFSKSDNVGIFGDKIKEYNIDSDVWRFYLILHRPETKDSNFMLTEFKNKVNSELCDNLGNLCNRILGFIKKNINVIDNVGFVSDTNKTKDAFIEHINKLTDEYYYNMDNNNIRKSFEILFDMSRCGNKYIHEKQPWKNIKLYINDTVDTIYFMYNFIGFLSKILYPFMPTSCNKICEQLGYKYLGKYFEIEYKNKIKLGNIYLLFNKLNNDIIL
jgi:methionyl-tRNA synthetase